MAIVQEEQIVNHEDEVAKTKAKLIALGVDERFIADRSTHPDIVAASWDIHPNTLGKQQAHRFPNLAPQSLLITPISNLWEDGCWWRLQNAMLYTAKAGYSVSIHEIEDKNYYPADAIAMMRWKASMIGRDGGIDKLLMIDSDVQLEEDSIVKMLAWDEPVVFPMLHDLAPMYPGIISPLSHPTGLAPNQGLVKVQWAAMSCMLFNPKIFNHLEPYAWRGDDYHFNQCLNNMGHHTKLDTNTIVNVTKGPRRDGSKNYEEKQESFRTTHDRHHSEERNRSAPPGWDPVFDGGMVDRHGTYYAMDKEQAKSENNGMNV